MLYQGTERVDMYPANLSEKNETPKKLIRLLVQLAVSRDPFTWDHSRRVERLALQLAQHTCFPTEKFGLLGQAAFLHDVGKVAIPEQILNKPTHLTKEEYRIMQQHTVLGHKLIQPLGLDLMIGNTVLYHHENYDGSGYPFGISGEAIPLEARIIRVVDFYDALVSPRPYRGAHDHNEAIGILVENRHCFDPSLFRIFLDDPGSLQAGFDE